MSIGWEIFYGIWWYLTVLNNFTCYIMLFDTFWYYIADWLGTINRILMRTWLEVGCRSTRVPARMASAAMSRPCVKSHGAADPGRVCGKTARFWTIFHMTWINEHYHYDHWRTDESDEWNTWTWISAVFQSYNWDKTRFTSTVGVPMSPYGNSEILRQQDLLIFLGQDILEVLHYQTYLASQSGILVILTFAGPTAQNRSGTPRPRRLSSWAPCRAAGLGGGGILEAQNLAFGRGW